MRVVREHERRELAREALLFARHHPAFEIVVVDGVENGLGDGSAERLRVGDRAADQPHREGLGVHLEGDLRRERPLSDDRGKRTVLALDELHRLALDLEFARFAYARGPHLEGLPDERLEGVHEGGVLGAPLVHGVRARVALASRGVELGERACRRKEAQRIRDAHADAGVPAGVELRHRLVVHGVARGRMACAHLPRRLAGLPAAVREFCARILREALALVGKFVENRAHLRAGQRREALPKETCALIGAGGHLHFRRKTEPLADLVHVVGAHAALLERVQERLLHLKHTLGRKRHVVLRRPPDVVVDLDELGGSMLVRLDVDLSGVVAAARDSVELGEADVG